MKKIRAAVLGIGNMGRGHLGELRKFEDVEVVALCSQPVSAGEDYNKQNGTNYPVYEDFDRMLDEVAIDVLYVCLPPFCHNGQIEKAARRGIHVFTEKPLALSLERGQSMADAVRESGVVSQVGYHMRFGHAVRRVRELVESGVAGKPTLFTASYSCNSLHTDWWRDRTKSGGQIFEQIIHLYDMAYYMMGNVDVVVGFISNLCHGDVPGYTVEDTSSVSMRFESGALGSITASNNAVPGKWVGVFKIVFENMVVEFDDHNTCRIIYTKEDNREETVTGPEQARTDEDRCFIDAVEGKRAPFATIQDGLEGLKIVCGACESSEKGGVAVRIVR